MITDDELDTILLDACPEPPADALALHRVRGRVVAATRTRRLRRFRRGGPLAAAAAVVIAAPGTGPTRSRRRPSGSSPSPPTPSPERPTRSSRPGASGDTGDPVWLAGTAEQIRSMKFKVRDQPSVRRAAAGTSTGG